MPMSRPVSVCVFCGSRSGASPAFEAAARATGALIGDMGWQLVYGGGRAGLTFKKSCDARENSLLIELPGQTKSGAKD